MVQTLTILYLIYMFIAIYMMSLFIIIYIKNRKTLFSYPKPDKKYTLSVLIPAYNEEATIENTVKSIFQSTYPIKEVIVINDGSKDNTKKIMKKLMKKYPRLKLIDKPNSGKANSLNLALNQTSSELVAIIDADSYPDKNAISKMVGFFNDSKVAAVTNSILVKNQNKFLEKLQAFEYAVIAWTRKLLDYIDSVYVTNGPLSIYRLSALKKIKGFDPHNLTEDIEVTWHLLSKGYKSKMCLAARTYTVVPSTFNKWKQQRIRWNIGGMQTINKYKSLFFRKNMLGYFIIPFFVFSLILGLFGLAIFIYLFIKRIIISYLSTSYSIYAQTAILSLQEINLTPSTLVYFGITLFFLGLFFTIFALRIMKTKILKKGNIFNLMFYTLVYLTSFPIILIMSIYRLITGKLIW